MTMGTGAITQYIDVAQIVLYVFWIFFFGLVIWLVREGKREGYPLISDRRDYVDIQGFPAIPRAKTFKLADGSESKAPHDRDRQAAALNYRRTGEFPGSPVEPVGDGLGSGLGPGAWTDRADHPDHMRDGSVTIRPLRLDADYSVSVKDVDPRGLPVVGLDGQVGGKVVDLWVDRAEMLFRYLEVETNNGKRILLPIPFARITKKAVKVVAIRGDQFAGAPTTKSMEQVTLLEEDKIAGYFGGGYLYATPERQEPLV
jgi:photosynthetic reaction center H subunit